MADNIFVRGEAWSRRKHIALRLLALTAIGATLLFSYRAHDTPDADETDLPMAPKARLAEPVAGIDDLPPLFVDTPLGEDADRLPEEELTQLDRPQLIGIAGRLPDDVEVLLRRSDGSSVSLRVGGRIDGYALKSVADDRAVFVKNGREILLRIPE